jgi:hypothetical protein
VSVPTIAIHGSGTRGEIARAVDTNFRSSPPLERLETVEFAWDRVAPNPSHTGRHNLFRFLKQHAGNISAASGLGMEFSSNYADLLLGSWQSQIQRLLQWLVPGLVSILVAIGLADLVVLGPAGWYGLPTLTFPLMGWVISLSGFLKVGIAVCCGVLLTLGMMRLVLTLSPRPLVITFRSLALLLLQPVLVFVLAALVSDLWMVAAIFGLLGASAFFTSGMGGLVWWGVSFAVVLGARALWGGPTLRGPLKALLDLFRYIGEPDYRTRIQHGLDKTIELAREQTGNHEEFVLAGQGLGAIIALDSVMHSRCWRRTDRVLLVTMGSPLRRFFLRFYPRTLFPESMDDVVDVAAGRVDELRWINIYRPWDYVGGSLGLVHFNGRDVCTDQRGRIVRVHSGYWSDLEVRRAFHRALQRIAPAQPLRIPTKDAAHRMPNPVKSGVELRLPSRARAAFTTLGSLATLAGMLWWVATALGVFAPRIERTPESLERGVVVTAAATHYREAVEHDHGMTYVNHWVFEFTDPEGMPKTVQVERDASDAFLRVPHRFDDRALTQHVRSACPNAKEMETRCTADSVRLRYYPGDISFFDLPDFPRHRFGTDPLQGWAEAGIVATLLSALIFVPVLFGVRVFALLLA